MRLALEERLSRLLHQIAGASRGARLARVLADELWPQVAEGERGRRLMREEEGAILGYGRDGV